METEKQIEQCIFFSLLAGNVQEFLVPEYHVTVMNADRNYKVHYFVKYCIF